VRAPSSANLGPTTGLSLEAWIRPPAAPAATATILRKEGQYLLRMNSAGALTLRLWKGGAITEVSTAGGVVGVGSWSHVAATWNGSTMLIYVNGVQRASGAFSGPIDSAGDSLYMGSSLASYDWLNARLDEVAIYGSALSSERVRAHHAAAGILPPPPVVRLDTPAAGSTMDASPNFGGAGATGSQDAASVAVKLYSGSQATGSPIHTLNAPVRAVGTFSVKLAASLASGVYTAQAEQSNSAGVVGRSSARTFTVDAEAAPVVLAAGDIAACDTFGDEATAAVLDRLGGTVVTVGDHVYEYATASDFTNCYDPTWGRHKARTKPVVGDHEYIQSPAVPYFDYFGAAAGDPAKGYYSFDVGSWHVVALNANCSKLPGGCGAGSPAEQWLRSDLAANQAACTLLVMHAPRFSSGSIHGNQSSMFYFWQAAYDHGAELVLSASEHVYERFAPQTPSGTADAARGVRQITVGTGGRSHYNFGTIKPNSEVRNNDAFGVLRLTLRSGAYDWQFVPEAGKTFADSGTTSCH
jgi:hypothetical protein